VAEVRGYDLGHRLTMGFFDSIRRAFGARRYAALTTRSGAFTFLGKPSGEVDVLEKILVRGLQHDPGLKRAFLSRVRYAGEARDRLALCIDTDTPPNRAVTPLAEHCAHYISSIDILFFVDLNQGDIDKLKSVVEPFYHGQPES
jgi:hypothetical protein